MQIKEEVRKDFIHAGTGHLEGQAVQNPRIYLPLLFISSFNQLKCV
jgi:hypothetical protein